MDHQNRLLFACQYHQICWFSSAILTACNYREGRKHQGYSSHAWYLHTTLIRECLHGKLNVSTVEVESTRSLLNFARSGLDIGMLCCLLQRWFSCCCQDRTPRLTIC